MTFKGEIRDRDQQLQEFLNGIETKKERKREKQQQKALEVLFRDYAGSGLREEASRERDKVKAKTKKNAASNQLPMFNFLSKTDNKKSSEVGLTSNHLQTLPDPSQILESDQS